MPVLRVALLLGVAALLACSGERDAPRTSSRVPASAIAPAAKPARDVVPDEGPDDFGDTLALHAPARRIVSLNPTTTEILFAIGAGDRVVGRTRWDVVPEAARRVRDLGDGLRPNVEAVLATRPDLVILYASRDNRPAAAKLRAAGIPTLALKIDRIAAFHAAVARLGRATGDTTRAFQVRDSVMRTLDRVRAATVTLPRPRVFWYIWDSPLITIGGGSYLNELLEIAGGTNVYGSSPEVSPAVTLEDLLGRDADVILAGPRGAAAIAADPAWKTLSAVRHQRVLIVDTTLVGSPAVRLGAAALSLAKLLHPGRVP